MGTAARTGEVFVVDDDPAVRSTLSAVFQRVDDVRSDEAASTNYKNTHSW